jgi:hypothetical protein
VLTSKLYYADDDTVTGEEGLRMAALEIYRSASIGRALTDALGEMVSSGKLDPLLALQVLLHFDEVERLLTDRQVLTSV